MRKITPENLIEYLYEETSVQKAIEIKAALANDWSLLEAYEQLASSQKQLKEVELSPREEVLKKILDYADDSVIHSHSH